MKLETLWIVRDPTPTCIPEEVCFEIPVKELGNYIVGGGPRTWANENSAVYTTEAEAKADAKKRLAACKATSKTPTYDVRRSDGKVVRVTVPED